MRFFAVALTFFGVAASYAQTPEVPHKMHFADLTLTIRDDARREIQKDVDALTKHPRYFGVKVERAKTYFPIIEKIFEEERLPLDFKYLVLQESALIADAVSVSNAVGFWQFKDFTALEMGLRVDKEIDERMNIYSATRGAAQYLKKNNYLFNNWLLALQSYQMGGGGVQRAIGDRYNGARHMEINSDTYWYVKKFLAYKIAFEDAVKGEPQVKVNPYPILSPKSLSELAKELAMDEATLREYNKWIRGNKIPADRTYALLVPAGHLNEDFNSLMVASNKDEKHPVPTVKPEVQSIKTHINGVKAIQAVPGETITSLASRAGISLSNFLRFNDMSIDATIQPGSYYFIKKKRNRAEVAQHTVRHGETLWSISQHYGIQLKQVKKLNKTMHKEPSEGDLVWLSAERAHATSLTPVAISTEVVEVDDDRFFNWEVKPATKNVISTPEPALTVNKTEVLEEVPALPSRDSIHQVKPKENLYTISKIYGVAVTDLLIWNNLTITDGLKIDQKLLIKVPIKPTKAASQDAKEDPQVIIHEVKGSDTLYSVARQYNVTIKDLMDWNKKDDFNLALGEKLTIWPK